MADAVGDGQVGIFNAAIRKRDCGGKPLTLCFRKHHGQPFQIISKTIISNDKPTAGLSSRFCSGLLDFIDRINYTEEIGHNKSRQDCEV